MKMPALFVGHGSPMNAIEDNRFTRAWQTVYAGLPRPEAFLSVSAHWYVPGTRVNDAAQPRVIYDMYGFPPALYAVAHKAPGAPALAREAGAMLREKVAVDNTWGIDHGTWSVLHVMDPEARIPVFQLSVDRDAEPAVHYGIGRQLASLRERGVLILGSGNVVHNLRRVDFDREDGFDWAASFDAAIRDRILDRRDDEVIRHAELGGIARQSVPTPDHFLPLLYVLGATTADEPVQVFNEACVMGSLSMTCYRFG